MKRTIEYTAEARRFLRKLARTDREAAKRLYDFLQNRLVNEEDPRRTGKALSGRFSKLWRYRVGNYRIICDIDGNALIILVVRIGHRREVYKGSATSH